MNALIIVSGAHFQSSCYYHCCASISMNQPLLGGKGLLCRDTVLCCEVLVNEYTPLYVYVPQ